MITHPVPQQISAFQFRLFGNLTIREFAFVGSGGLFAFLVFLSPLPNLIKIPLILILAGGGAAAGLVPIQGRPLDRWLLNFVRAIFSPTQRIWRKVSEIPYFLQPVTLAVEGPTLTPFTLTESHLRLEEYLKSLPSQATPLDAAERLFLDSLDFELKMPAGVAVRVAPMSTRRLTVEEQIDITLPRKISQITSTGPVALPKSDEAVHVLPGLEVEKRRPTLKPKKTVSLASEINFSQEQVIIIPQGDIAKIVPGIGNLRARRLHSQPDLSAEINLPIHREKRFEISDQLKERLGLVDDEKPQPVPKTPTITISDKQITRAKTQVPPVSIPKPTLTISEPKSTKPEPSADKKTIKPAQTQLKSTPTTTRPTVVKSTAASVPPFTNTPNVLSGIVVDKNGSTLETTIILVKNEAKIPVRALKTNKIGQFMISTPLPNGVYTIEAEKESYNFDIIEIQAQGGIMPPIEIKAK